MSEKSLKRGILISATNQKTEVRRVWVSFFWTSMKTKIHITVKQLELWTFFESKSQVLVLILDEDHQICTHVTHKVFHFFHRLSVQEYQISSTTSTALQSMKLLQ